MNRQLLSSVVFLAGLILFFGILVGVSSLPPPAEPESTPTFEPTKFARYVPAPTATPSLTFTPTWTFAPTQTSTPTRTRTATRTVTPTTKPSLTATATSEPINVGERYGTLAVPPSAGVTLSEVNLSVRAFVPTNSILGLVDYTGPFDEGAPQLNRVFSDERFPLLLRVYQLYEWDLNCNCRGAAQSDPPVTLVGAAVTPGEILRLPRSSYYIAEDYQALVLYADAERLTLNYTRSANPVRGYTLYLEGIATDSTLLNLYQRADSTGRTSLPAIQAGQGLGRARGNELRIAIRDAGGFMDPRSRKDWWRGK